MSFFDSLKDTLKSLGGAAVAPVGLTWDLASSPFDSTDDDLGTLVNKVAKRGTDMLDPLTNNNTWSGYAFGQTMHGLDWAWKTGVDRPVSTAQIMVAHALPGADKSSHFGDFFDSESWAKAYQIAKDQNLGQSAMFNLTNQYGSLAGLSSTDPLSVKGGTPFEQSKYTKAQPFLSNAGAATAEIGVQWVADPGVLAGKSLGYVRQFGNLGKLRATDKFGLYDKISEDADRLTGLRSAPGRLGLGKRDLASRTDDYLGYINGENRFKRGLNAAEIYQTSPELKRATEGQAIAGLLHDAQSISDDVSVVRNTQRRILAVAAGDESQILRLKGESENTQAIADALANLRAGETVKLTTQALHADARYSPEFTAEFERQLGNVQASGSDISGFVDDWSNKVQSLSSLQRRSLDASESLDFLPGSHNLGHAGNAGLRKIHSDTVLDKVVSKQDAAVSAAKGYAEKAPFLKPTNPDVGRTTIFQKSLHHVPLMLAHPSNIVASAYTKVPRSFADALMQTHYVGVAELHDWGGSTTQLDSMMRIAGVDDATRLGHLSDAYKAKSEAEKMRAIAKAEHLSMDALRQKAAAKLGDDIDADFIKTLMVGGQGNRAAGLTQLNGRSYAATVADSDLATRMTQQAMDQASAQAGREAGTASTQATWRIDQIPDENGIPMALPVISTQLANKVPLFDVERAKNLLDDELTTKTLQKYSRAWKQESLTLRGLQNRAARAKGGVADTLAQAIKTKRAALDFLEDAANQMTRFWKFSVLFRLGYPVRVLMDDHMRIAAQMHYAPFFFSNGSEGTRNFWYNRAPAFIKSDGLKAQAAQAFAGAQAERAGILTQLGRDHSDKEWDELMSAIKAGDEKTVARLDPEGKIAEWNHHKVEAQRLASSAAGHKAAATRHQRALSQADEKALLGLPTDDRKVLNAKATASAKAAAEAEAGRAYHLEQMGDLDPDALRRRLKTLNEALIKGPKAFRGDKRIIGTEGVPIRGTGLMANGAFAGPTGLAYHVKSSSQASFEEQLDEGSSALQGMISSGAWRTVQPNEPGHLHVWADVLNHQFRNSPELMAFVKGKVHNPREFGEWLADPAQAHLRDRMTHYAHDPEDWGNRLQQLFNDYIPTEKLQKAVADGKVTPRQLDRMFQDVAQRPAVHGQLVDANTGRSTAVKAWNGAINRIYKALGEWPTDKLSRHPYFNTIYKQEIRDLSAKRIAHYREIGKEFTQDDLYELERVARQRSLRQLKQTLWDISAHSHFAHTARFLSPFFAAHQEALTRWWRLASDDPSLIRKFQLGFDVPRKMGLVYDSQTGELVKPGESISANHRIMFRIPWVGNQAPINRWIKKMGGGKYWSVNENGFNIILQGGIFNPGVGPVVTMPMETLVQKYANEPDIEKVARILNPYPPQPVAGSVALGAVTPAVVKRAVAYIHGPGNYEWNQRYAGNLTDLYVKFREANGRQPTSSEVDALNDRAAKETNRDVFLMLLSNAGSPVPAKPESKYAAVQHGWYQIQSRADAEGKDFTWALDQFRHKYGDIYAALVYSLSDNPGRLTGTRGEVSAVKRHKSLLGNIDPMLTRMVVGPEAAMDAKADPKLGEYSSAARQFLEDTRVNSHSSDTMISTKNPDQVVTDAMVQQGWEQYNQLTNFLQVQAQKRGLKSYEDDKQLEAARSAGIAYLKQSNFAWGQQWDSFATDASKYNSLLDDMRQVASNKKLLNDPTRQDVYWLGQYLQVRDMIGQALKQRAAAGGAKTLQSASNADLAKAYAAAVDYIRQQNTYFDNYEYDGVIERDPMLADARGNH